MVVVVVVVVGGVMMMGMGYSETSCPIFVELPFSQWLSLLQQTVAPHVTEIKPHIVSDILHTSL